MIEDIVLLLNAAPFISSLSQIRNVKITAEIEVKYTAEITFK